MNKIEQTLAKQYNRKYCLLVGNATTAIYLSLLSKGLINKTIAIPNNVCMNVVLPIYFSNNIPLFVDIEKKTFGLDISKLQDKKIDCIIAVHAYGNVCDIERIENFAKKNNIFLIEDVAVAQGMFFRDKPLGSFGDVSVLSFGSGKNIDIEHGGAVLTDNDTIYNEIKKYSHNLDTYSIDKEATMDTISKQHTKLYNIDYGKSLPIYAHEFKNTCLVNQNSFLFKFDTAIVEKLENSLDRLSSFLTIREKNSQYLNNKFKNIDGIIIIEPKYGSSFWRFNIFIENYRDELFRYLLDKKYKVSTWYHSIDLLFENRIDINTPISDWIGKNIINIWVNEEIDQNYLDDISNDIINFLGTKYGK